MIEDPDLSSSGPAVTRLDLDLEDEALAAAARARYRTDGLPGIEPDGDMRSALDDDEQLLAVRETVTIDQRPMDGSPPASGRLAITTKRLMVVDERPLTLASFEELDDVMVVGDQLVVTLRSGSGFTVTAIQPRLLRVQLAEARARRLDQTRASSNAASEVPSDLRRR
jgi:hypothetical protein